MKSNPVLLSVLLFFVMAGCANPAAAPPASTLPAGEPTVIAAGTGAAVVATTTVAPSATPATSPTATQTPAPAPTATVTPIMVTAIAALPTTPAAMPTLPATAPAIPISLGALAATLPAAAATSAPGPSIEVPAHLPARTDLARGVQISFLGADRHPDGSSTWRYRVERQEGARKLKLWGLQLPDCVQVVTASPEGWKMAQADDQPGAWGISWETKGNFRSGEFTVTVSGAVAAGSTNVAVQSAQLAVGPITGPDCE